MQELFESFLPVEYTKKGAELEKKAAGGAILALVTLVAVGFGVGLFI